MLILPIGHDQGIRRLPWVTISVIAVCTLVQAYSTFGGPSSGDLRRALETYQAAAQDGDGAAAGQHVLALLEKVPVYRFGYHTGSGFTPALITSAFVHAGWLHLIGNMLFLWLCGSVLEDRWGRIKFALFYGAGAVVATLAFQAFYSGPETILVGASGAISAAMGAFLVSYARTQITLWYWLLFRTGTFMLAAYFALPLWLADQALSAYLDRDAGGVSSVAYGAHFGGFAFGVVVGLGFALIFRRRDHDDDESDERRPASAAAAPAGPTSASRYDKCMEAIRKQDDATVRLTASRVILDLARAHDPAPILALYREMVWKLTDIPLTDGAFVAAAAAADAAKEASLYAQIVTAFAREQPTSLQLPKVLWRLAELHRDEQRLDQAVTTLQLLADRFPTDPLGIEARRALDRRAGS